MIRSIIIGSIATLALFASVQTWRIDRLKADIANRDAELSRYAGYEDRAKADAQRADDQCAVRVKDARQSARAIERIIERPVHVDPQGCAVRELVPAGELLAATGSD